ncbi:4-hydroxy-tetrahydrodipicolinate reductase [Aciduricibacillus chroicocephali]|uniref:4-hydroxy-tetrahydrodipicolinate reductase n=1 Tax=Aciduricibacillus chroicocephali TaxID=3054939 RepID=A0ABY9KZ80_9BACI|nr:4-hydroxy-tetrahydrodipicolinate reductase [Bacillaceae bacterium 44XB]
MSIKVIIAGPRGKMGREAIQMIESTEHFQLVAYLDRKNKGRTNESAIPVYEDPDKCFAEVQADVLVDLTTPEVGFSHTESALKHGIRPVVGTSGFKPEEIDELKKLADEKKIGCIIAPNFAVGAVLLMQFAKMAAKYFPDVEIIEKHHDQKLDAPSGTAMKTLELIKENRTAKAQGHPNEIETLAGARGGESEGIRIHSVRLPGLVAHEEVLFGGNGQLLTIKHDSMNRQSFMEGIKMSIDEVMKLDHLVYGLENLLELNN